MLDLVSFCCIDIPSPRLRTTVSLFFFIAFRTNKPSDVISTLVSIYDSKDLFVKELQVLLAQRLLTLTKDDTERVEREVRLSLPLTTFLSYPFFVRLLKFFNFNPAS